MTRPGQREASLTPFAALAEPLRRRLFLFVASTAEPVAREQAAEVLGIARSVAAFHLDKLAAAGVLAVEYRRPPGRTGPGAGRPAKRYWAVERELVFSVPERHYELAAAILVRAVANAEAEALPIADALRAAARSFGRAIGADSEGLGNTPANECLEEIAILLAPYGYEPRVTEGRLALANCPFHTLTEGHRETICRMNLRLLKGVLKGARARDLVASPNTSPGACCVTIKAR